MNNFDNALLLGYSFSPFKTKSEISSICIILMLSLNSFGQLTVSTDVDKAIYSAGDVATFEINSTTSGTATYTIKYDDYTTPISTGSINLTAGVTSSVTHSEATEGVVFCKVVQGGNTAIATAAFSPYEIESFELEPSDLKSFWNSKIQDLAAVAMNPVVTLHSTDTYSTTYNVELDNIDGRKVYGYLSVPNTTGPFPAVITLPPYGNAANITNPEKELAERAGVLSFSVGIHNVLPSQVDPNAYQPDDYTDPNTNYYKYALLGAVRAIDYIYSRSDFDGQNVGATGISQGGGLALNIASIDDRINLLMYSVPALSQVAGLAHGKASGFPNYVYRSRIENGTAAHEAATIDATRYYDAMFHARYCDFPVLVNMSYIDEVTPLATGYAAFNQLPKDNERVLLHSIKKGHESPGEYWLARYDFIHRHFPTSQSTTTFPWSTTNGYQVDAGNPTTGEEGDLIPLTATIDYNSTTDPAYDLQWSVMSGPGTVTFTNPNSYSTNATFNMPGDYVLKFKADDMGLMAAGQRYFSLVDYVTVTVTAISLSPLPVELVDFSSIQTDQSVHLHWRTENEFDNRGFEIQRTDDSNSNFSKIGWVDASPQSQGSNYFFEDKNVASGKTYYYRLKQIDYDDVFTFSPIVTEQFRGQEISINIFPNPVTTELQVSILGKNQQKGEVQILNSIGVILQKENINFENVFQKGMNVSQLPKGTYFLKYENTKGKIHVLPFFKK